MLLSGVSNPYVRISISVQVVFEIARYKNIIVILRIITKIGYVDQAAGRKI